MQTNSLVGSFRPKKGYYQANSIPNRYDQRNGVSQERSQPNVTSPQESSFHNTMQHIKGNTQAEATLFGETFNTTTGNTCATPIDLLANDSNSRHQIHRR